MTQWKNHWYQNEAVDLFCSEIFADQDKEIIRLIPRDCDNSRDYVEAFAVEYTECFAFEWMNGVYWK